MARDDRVTGLTVDLLERRLLAAELVRARKAAGLSRKELADRMETDYRSISRMESGTHLPSTRSLQRFARVTGARLRIEFETVGSSVKKGPQPMKPGLLSPRAFLDHLTSRRTLLGGAAAFALGSTLSTSAAQEATPSASPPPNGVQEDGSWVFTDARGVTVTLPAPPQRIVADLSAAAPLWDFGIRPIAISGRTVTTELAWGNVDRSLEVIVNDAFEIDIERLVELQPDLYVSVTWSPDIVDRVWGITEPGIYQTVLEVAPIVTLSMTGDLGEGVERFAELAGLLGADLESPDLVAAKAAYDRASENLARVASEKSDLEVLFAYISPEDQGWSVASTERWADLKLFQKLGVNIVLPDNAEGGYWESVSYEQALKYPADVLFNSARVGTYTLQELAELPTFSHHPAVEAGQLGSWNQDFIQSYQGVASSLDNVAEVLSVSEKIL